MHAARWGAARKARRYRRAGLQPLLAAARRALRGARRLPVRGRAAVTAEPALPPRRGHLPRRRAACAGC
eukprot:9881606-Lingulodinium_polyedra.AAC.1